MPDGAKVGKRIKAVETSFDIVEYLNEHGKCGVSELSNSLALSKSTIHAHLNTLTERGYLFKEDGKYRLGMGYLKLGGNLLMSGRYKRFYKIAKPEVDELADESSERVQLTVVEDGRGYFLYQAVGSQAVMSGRPIGSQVPLHATGAGKAILAHRDEARVEEWLDAAGLEKFTENTITSRDTFLDELEDIRERGLAFDRGEQIEGIRCVAAPIVTDDGDVEGAISVSYPKKRADKDFFQNQLPERLQNSARVISLNIEYQ